MDYPKSTPGVGLVNGQFVDENKTTGTPGSLIPAKWGNDVTEELRAVITAAGFAPSEDQNNQLLQAIRKISLRVGEGVVSGQRPILVSPTVGQAWTDSALEIREAQAAGSEAVDESYAPAIAFHWGSKTANRLWMDAAGLLRWGADALITAGAAATEAVRGLLRIGTQGEVNAGTLDNVAVTPKKLRWGSSYLIAANGYLVFPQWLGGLVIQWATVQLYTNGTNGGVVTYTLPMAFPNNFFGALAIKKKSALVNGGEPAQAEPVGLSQLSLSLDSVSGQEGAGNRDVFYFALGN